jgi:hypothetical protein
MDLNGKIIEKFHTGIDKGFVGGKSMMKSNESLAMLMEGEAVLTPEQMDKFMRITLPTMLGMNPTTFGGGGGIEINMPLTVEGGITSEALPDFKLAMKEVAETVIGQVNKAMSQRGQIRNAKAVSI